MYAIQVVSELHGVTTDAYIHEGEYGPTALHSIWSDDVMTFMTAKAAESFAKKWKPHPWWIRKDGWKVIEIRPVYKQVLDHYEVVSE